MADERQAEKVTDLVFEGGGVKGIGLAGAYAALSDEGWRPKSVAGTSAGAITAALVATGFSPEELDLILREIPFDKFKDTAWEDHLPAGRVVSLLKDHGIYEGRFFRDWMAGLLARKGVTKFGQLVNPDAESERQRYRLRVIASDVTHRRLLVLPDDARHLGIDPDEMEIADAVRMSMSIPIFFEPVVHRNPRTNESHVIVDGGMLSNFPVWLFDREGAEPRWPTFGLLLVEPDPKKPIGAGLPGEEHGVGRGSLVDYVKSLASTMMDAHDRMYVEKANFARTIPIPTLGVGTTEFDIDEGRVRALHQSGYDAACAFLKTWDFDAYIREFRRGKEHSRRAEIAAELGTVAS